MTFDGTWPNPERDPAVNLSHGPPADPKERDVWEKRRDAENEAALAAGRVNPGCERDVMTRHAEWKRAERELAWAIEEKKRVDARAIGWWPVEEAVRLVKEHALEPGTKYTGPEPEYYL